MSERVLRRVALEREMYPYDGTPSTIWFAGKPALVQIRMDDAALAFGCVELWHASLSAAFGPGWEEAVEINDRVFSCCFFLISKIQPTIR